MFKMTLLASLIALPFASHAHGPIPQQASMAIQSATQMFLKEQPREIRNQFNSVSAVIAGHEIFNVRFGLVGPKGESHITYRCTENEDVTPIVWECKLN